MDRLNELVVSLEAVMADPHIDAETRRWAGRSLAAATEAKLAADRIGDWAACLRCSVALPDGAALRRHHARSH